MPAQIESSDSAPLQPTEELIAGAPPSPSPARIGNITVDELTGSDTAEGYQKLRDQFAAAYEKFRDPVDSLASDLDEMGAQRQDHESHIASGANESAFQVKVDDRPYIFRLTHRNGEENRGIDRSEAFVRSHGIPHLEQGVAFSEEKGIFVSEVIPGTEFRNLTLDDLKSVTKEQLKELLATVQLAAHAGVIPDPKPSNFLYDRREGFGLVDLSELDGDKEKQLADDIASIANVICNAGTFAFTPKTREQYVQYRDLRKEQLRLAHMYKQICLEHLSEEELQQVLPRVEKEIEVRQTSLDRNLSDEGINKALALANKTTEAREKLYAEDPTRGWGSVTT